MSWWKVLLLIVVVLTAIAVTIVVYGRQRWQGLTDDLQQKLALASNKQASKIYDVRELEGLPPIVQRYFRAVLKEGVPIVSKVKIEHVGQFNMSESGEQWLPFESRQLVTTSRPGFIWDARVKMFPGLAVFVHDAYVAGDGILRPSILGAFDLVYLHGGNEVAQGEFMRYFAEAAWYPTALLPSQGVRWEGIDERSARATMSDGPITLSLTFTFAADGLIESVRADARGRTQGKQVVMRPWEGRWRDYQWHGGMYVPSGGEVAWLLPENEGGRKPYWRGTITSIAYEPRGMK
jgi:hypothetical protein